MDRKEIHSILEAAVEKGREAIPNGEVASYIPELSKANKDHIGLSISTIDGRRFNIGDTDIRFTIQSISKIISLAIALEHLGFEKVFSKVGMEPSGEAFNSLVELDLNSNKPFNPMINSGALTVSSLLLPEFTFEQMMEYSHKVCLDPEIGMNDAVFQSEMSHISRNRAIAYLL